MARTSPPAYAPDVNTAERGPAPGQGRQEAGNRQSENKIADTDGLRRFARDCTDVAGVWKLYMDQAKIEDERLAKILSSDLDPLLLFATLFSGILAAFLIEVRKGLEEDLQVTTNTLLNTTNQLVTMLINNQPNLTDLQPQSAGSFEPTTTTRSVNGLWFSSLMFSLTSALGASLAKGWITQFSLADSGLYWTNAEKHHRRLSDMRRWHVKWIIQCLSLLIHIAFFLFAVGLAQLLFGDDIVIGIFIGALTGIVFVMYLANTVHPIFSSTSPFRTPLSGMLRQIFRPTAQETNVLPSSKDALKAHALAWLMMMSLDPQVIRAAIRATAGLPHSRDVQAELLLSPVIYILSSGLSELLDPGSETKDMTKDMTASASYLYTLLHLVEPVPAKSDEVERLYEALETLVLPGGALFVTDSLPPQIRELALCVRGRILLLLCVEEEEQAEDKKQSDEIFDTDIPILTRACPHGQLRDELQGVLSISDPTQDGSMKAIVSRFGVPALLNGLRGGAGRIVLKQCARRLSDLMAYDRIYFQLGMDENIKCMCIALQDMFLHSDSAIRRWAVNGFKKLADYAEIRKVMRTSKLMEVFVTLLADADIQVRAAALETLTEFAEIRAAIGTSKTIGELVKLLAAEDSQVRMATINALGGLAEHEELRAAVGTPQTIGNVLSRMEDDEEDVRSAAINAFKKFSTHSEIRETMGTPEAVGELLALLVDREWEVRLATLNVLAELAEYEQIRVVIGTSETLGKVVGCVADHDPDVRTAAIDTLKKLATHADICTAMGTPETIGEFLKLMEVERWRVRVVAINTLIELAEHSEIRVVLASPEILKKIVSCLADEDLDVRAAVIDALKQLAEYPDIRVEGMGTPATIGQLVDLLAPEDGLVQVATIKTLAELAVHFKSWELPIRSGKL
ncbi:armadillo-type protein [Mycena maculata]|uniref:Vacuolar protein 8 n=1 Tax=Mycena maculata TaxID=230809 RepID=A0AAD7K0M4_9AGAR|nr:armadillo-type protein [Mycena maculata]